MRCVVTGATGHVGGNLVRLLLQRGHAVRATIFEDGRALDGLHAVERVRADVLDPASLDEAIRDAEVVFHLAAVIAIAGKKDRMRRVNERGARNVAEAALAAGVRRLVHFSSIHAFSHLPGDQPITEDRGPAEPDAMFYDQTKAAGEREVLAVAARGLDAVILNPTGIIGPHDYKPSHMGQVLLRLRQRKLPALVNGGFDWVDVRDVAAAALAAAQVGRAGERYLLSGSWASVAELAGVVEQVTGVPAPRWTSPMWLARAGAPVAATFNRLIGRRPLFTSSSLSAIRRHRWVSSDKARQALGFRTRPLSETVRDTFAWFDHPAAPASEQLIAKPTS